MPLCTYNTRRGPLTRLDIAAMTDTNLINLKSDEINLTELVTSYTKRVSTTTLMFDVALKPPAGYVNLIVYSIQPVQAVRCRILQIFKLISPLNIFNYFS